jgi:hypothetical protein
MDGVSARKALTSPRTSSQIRFQNARKLSASSSDELLESKTKEMGVAPMEDHSLRDGLMARLPRGIILDRPSSPRDVMYGPPRPHESVLPEFSFGRSGFMLGPPEESQSVPSLVLVPPATVIDSLPAQDDEEYDDNEEAYESGSYSDSESGSESDSESVSDDEEDEHGRLARPRGPPEEDRSFPGALGFGAQGDLCMYQHIDQLSAPCLGAISDVHALRQQYWQEESSAVYHGHGLMLVKLGAKLVGGIALLALACRVFTRKRHRATYKLLAGLNANPELKAKVESELGVTVPPHGASKCAMRSKSCCQRLLLALALLVFTLVASLCISISSLELTCAIVDRLDSPHVDPQTGQAVASSETSPAVAMLILFLICSSEVLLLGLFIRLGNKMFRSCTNSDCNGEGQAQLLPSAPLVTRVADPAPGLSAGPSPSRTVWPTWMQQAPAQWLSIFQRRAGYPSDGYVPLLAEDTEMVAVGMARPTVQGAPGVAVFTGAPLQPHQISITAMPVNHVSFV